MGVKRSSRNSNLPESAYHLLTYLRDKGATTQRELIEELDLPLRTIRYSLRRLKERGYIISKANLDDMRSIKYAINPEIYVDLNSVIHKEFEMTS
ncbi:MAG: winged helix-turn-helix transcriptional regulator, partial [Candidatus Kariarchaeaceae archaeon]